MPRLTILISTIDDGLISVNEGLLPCCNLWQYIIIWQRRPAFHLSEEVQKAEQAILNRTADIQLYYSKSLGISASRNEALTLWKDLTGFALISDDDMRYTKHQLLSLIEAFNLHPEADILCCQVENSQGVPLKEYPNNSFYYSQRPKGYYISSVEIALRNNPLPTFDTRFGVGAPFLCAGEEELFIHECFLQGLKVRYLPLLIGRLTNELTTSQKPNYATQMQYTKGAVLKKTYGNIGGLLRIIKMVFLPLKKDSFARFKNYLKGYFYI